MRTILSRAPVRICDIGGWTDTWFYPKGAVFSFAINLYSYIRIQERTDKKVNIFSENLDLQTKIKNLQNIEYDGTLDLLKATIKRMSLSKGLDIYARADIPPGSGMGTSASIAVALIAALSRDRNESTPPIEVAQLAHKIETKELKLESGVQDQFAAAHGGISFMEIDYPKVNRTSINISQEKICQIESQMMLIYLSSRSSSEMHKIVIEKYLAEDEHIRDQFNILKECAYQMKKAIISNDLEKLGMIMNKNWKAQKELHPLMTNETIKKIETLAFKNGAIGFKCNGAGGGGSITLLAGVGKEFTLKKKIIDAGFNVHPVNLNFKGVETWEI